MIRGRVLDLVEKSYHSKADPIGGRFVWLENSQSEELSIYRTPDSESELRKIDEIPTEELRLAAMKDLTGDQAGEVAKRFGIRRLSSSNRERIEEALGLSSSP